MGRWALVVTLVMQPLLFSCTSFMHGYTLPKYERKVLAVAGGPGLERLRIERNFDSTIDSFMVQYGTPEYVYVADGKSVQLIYLRQDFVATFQRTSYNPVSTVTVERGVPEEIKQRVQSSSPGAGPSPGRSFEGTPQDESTEPIGDTTPPEIVGSGTCFAVRPDGEVLTSHHVIAGARNLVVRFAGFDAVAAEVIRGDPNNDLALLSVPIPTPHFLPLGRANDAPLGEPVFTIGFPVPQVLGLEPKYTEGVVSSKSGMADLATLFQLTIPVQPGNSGGPVVNARGEVLGVVAASAAVETFLRDTGTLPQNVNWAVKAEYAAPLFAPPPPVRSDRSRSRAIERAEKAVCLVLAFN